MRPCSNDEGKLTLMSVIIANKTRFLWMDFIRGICIFLVISLHAWPALESQAGLTIPPYIEFINRLFFPFRMTILMFLSGMLLSRSLKKPAREFFIGKFNLIYWPFLVWSLVVLFAEQRFTIEYILKTPISAPTLLWYLWFLCAYYILAYFVVRFSIPLIAVIIGSMIASIFLPDFLRLSRFAYLFSFFMLGHLVMVSNVFPLRNALIGLIALGAAMIGALLSAYGLKVSYVAQHSWIAVSMIVFILWSCQYYKSNFLSYPLEWVGRNSIVFYVVHFPVQCIFARMVADNWHVDTDILYLFAIIIALLGAVLVQLLRERSTAVAGLFDFGIYLRAANRLNRA